MSTTDDTQTRTTVFVRVGGTGQAVGPFRDTMSARDWLHHAGYETYDEGAAFKLYEAVTPSDFLRQHQMREPNW